MDIIMLQWSRASNDPKRSRVIRLVLLYLKQVRYMLYFLIMQWPLIRCPDFFRPWKKVKLFPGLPRFPDRLATVNWEAEPTIDWSGVPLQSTFPIPRQSITSTSQAAGPTWVTGNVDSLSTTFLGVIRTCKCSFKWTQSSMLGERRSPVWSLMFLAWPVTIDLK